MKTSLAHSPAFGIPPLPASPYGGTAQTAVSCEHKSAIMAGAPSSVSAGVNNALQLGRGDVLNPGMERPPRVSRAKEDR